MTTARRPTPLRSPAAFCALGAIGASLTVLAACGHTSTVRSSVAEAARTSPTTASPTASLSRDQAERRDLVAKTRVRWDQAAATAVREVPRGKLVDLDLQPTPRGATTMPGTPGPGTPGPAPSAGSPQWAARVAAADGTVHRVDVDAVTGKVFRSRVEPDQDADDRRKVANRSSMAAQTPAQAVQAATGRTGGTVTGVDLDENDAHQLLWSVDVITTDNWNRTTFDVDATNGRILRQHVDRD
jgi:uncharacterized membrane protein YkoI